MFGAMQYRRLMAGLAATLALAAAATAPSTHAATAETPKVGGLWCGTGLLRGSSMRLTQHDEAFDGTLVYRGRERPLQGRVDGGMLRAESKRYGELAFSIEGDEIRLASAEGMMALAKGTTFQRSAAEQCG